MSQNRHDRRTRPDAGFVVIVVLVAINAVWLLLTPLIPAVAATTLRRFHLRSHSFAVWALQFPIPSMYNFANRYEVREFPPGLVDPIIEVGEKRYVNHFPCRVLTFANGRYRHLGSGKDRWFVIESSYRGQRLQTRLHVRPNTASGFDVIRLADEEEFR